MSATPSAASALTERWNRFRTGRNKALAAEHGWLTLTSFQWLPAGPGPLKLVPGLWSTDGTTATLTAGADEGLVLVETGEPVDGTIEAVLDDEESLMWVRHGSVVVELAMRAGRYAIRTRDAASPVYTEFTEVPVFGYNQMMVVEGRFEPFEEPRAVEIGTANPEVPGTAVVVGEVVLELAGTTYRLAAEEGALGSLVITFHDATNGDTTDGWRKLELTRPRPDGTVVVDFNRTINYPSAFTDYGTCPMPVPGNLIEAPIEAGEKLPE
ncbi:DUF1684 domain-containing protein [Arthrobacter sp. 35W]|uniref:DUF1684 domain-containing protein n=1 Tax=Arthrobacter sp. 35W TaxID=1132441 RepID=UPI0003FF6C15|nr:DUF1684 domain-containing protein [Arthrobacter sp. 35W]